MDRGLLTDRAQLEALFDELADEFSRLGTSADVVMVGGSWMLWHSRRASTGDVDSARRLDNDLNDAIERIGARHDLRPGWLNDAATPFWPAGARYEDCQIVYERRQLVVRTPGPDVIFLMKLYRADPQDREDLVSLWPMCNFANAQVVLGEYARAYPHAPDDEYLGGYIADIAREAGTP